MLVRAGVPRSSASAIQVPSQHSASHHATQATQAVASRRCYSGQAKLEYCSVPRSGSFAAVTLFGGACIAAARQRQRCMKRLPRTNVCTAATPTDADYGMSLFPNLSPSEQEGDREVQEEGKVQSLSFGVDSQAESELTNIAKQDVKDPRVEAIYAEPEGPCTVLDVKSSLAIVRSGTGLGNSARPGTRVKFEGGAEGVVLVWKESLGAVAVVQGRTLAGDTAKRLSLQVKTACSKSLGGRIIDPAGQPVDEGPPLDSESTEKLTFADFKGMQDRKSEYKPCYTGVLGVDFSVPVGRGQTMLFQGSDRERDKEHLWPDLMAIRPGPDVTEGLPCCVCACETLDEARRLRDQLVARGLWQDCVIVVPNAPSPGGMVIAVNAAVALAEYLHDNDGEVVAMFDLEPLHKVWTILADVVGEERRSKGIIANPEDEKWTEMEGTVLRESISERRKYWFALISRAINSKEHGSVTLLAWAWEHVGGLEYRKQQAFRTKLDSLLAVPGLDGAVKQKLVRKVYDEAFAAGASLDGSNSQLSEPDLDSPGMPNWEIEELKSCTDGHIMLQRIDEQRPYGWSVDLYRSVPRLGTDALHPALLSVGAHRLRLKMLQAKDRSTHLQTTRGSELTLDERPVELRHAELVTGQAAGAPLSVKEAVARLVIAENADCKPLGELGRCTVEVLAELSTRLLESAVGQRLVGDLGDLGAVAPSTRVLLQQEVDGWSTSVESQ